jgi:large subunit ribosomal protein L30
MSHRSGVAAMTKRLRITYVKSAIGYSERQKGTIRALGFRKLNQTVEHDDTPGDSRHG